MSLDNNALMKAAGIGAGVMFVLSLLTAIPISRNRPVAA